MLFPLALIVSLLCAKMKVGLQLNFLSPNPDYSLLGWGNKENYFKPKLNFVQWNFVRRTMACSLSTFWHEIWQHKDACRLDVYILQVYNHESLKYIKCYCSLPILMISYLFFNGIKFKFKSLNMRWVVMTF